MASAWGTIIMAAGSGQRFGGETPKQYAPLCGRPVLSWSLETLANQGPVVIVVNPDHAPFYTPVVQGRDFQVVAGGKTRQESVAAGLKALKGARHVLIHDAARPLLDMDALTRIKQTIEGGAKAATLAMPVVDTLMCGTDVIDRAGVQAIQTPQAFDYDLALEAHTQAKGSYTDDASLVQAEKGVAAIFVTGHPDNFKITTQDDLTRAEKLLLAAYADTRTGLGFDVHRFGPGDKVRLFGVDIPSPRSLIGHSDADAGLHAIADAILGTIGAGDIGVHFPPSDPQWKNMDSAVIVEKAIELLHAKGGILRHVDIMLMAEFPRIGAHREAIVQRLSQILCLPADAIGLKATTTEKMGYIGRGEGLAVQAIATVRMKR
jgi:2-C-methyl-D-erythritol 4-phosphate cytidylyltransferase/2-C-methyl-D-erythritol 2,4-cyclodiphosphate synthase